MSQKLTFKNCQENKNNKITSYLLSEIVFQVGDKTEIKEKYAKIKLDIKNESFKKALVQYRCKYKHMFLISNIMS